MREIPENWFVLYSNEEEFNIINNHFKYSWSYIDIPNHHGYSTNKVTNWVGGSRTKKDLEELNYTQLSFYEFEKYIIKKETFYQDYKYLEKLLKKLKIK